MPFNWEDQDSVDRVNLSFDYAWKWFEYHASQRLALFRLSFVVAGILASGLAFSAENELSHVVYGLCAFGCVSSFIFLFFDFRNAAMVKWGEAILRGIEDNALFSNEDLAEDGTTDFHGILTREKKENECDWQRHKFRFLRKWFIRHGTLIFSFHFALICGWIFIAFIYGQPDQEDKSQSDEPTRVIVTIEDSPQSVPDEL